MLDLSWNCLGSCKNKAFAQKLAELLSTQEGLLHLDISHNMIKKDDCAILAQGITNNHSLWGLHISGNEACMTPLGYINIGGGKMLGGLGSESDVIQSRIKGWEVTNFGVIPHNQDYCWLCEGWNVQKFEITLGTAYKEIVEGEVKLHLEFENYEPNPMQLVEEKRKVYVAYRMCPPGTTKFFFSLSGKPLTNPLYPLQKTTVTLPKYNIDVENVHSATVTQNRSLINENNEPTIKECEPRLLFKEMVKKGKKTDWKIENSIFKDSLIDTDNLLAKCFEADWKNVKPPTMLEVELEVCRGLLKAHYKKIYIIYKYYSILGRTENVFAINKTVLTDLLVHKMNACKPEDLVEFDLTFTTIKGRQKVGKYQPKTALIRCEFLELILRIALGAATKGRPSTILREFLETKLDPAVPIDPQEFRENQYWCMECDNFLKAYYSLFTHLLEFRGKNMMSVDDFIEIWSELKLINENFTERDAMIAYINSQGIEVDELENDKHMRMNIYEFMEGVARVTYIISTKKTLHEKLDSFVTKLIGGSKKEFREHFKKPDKVNGLYVIQSNTPNEVITK